MTRADPSPWLLDHAVAIREAGELGPVLDLASGRGRHALAVATLGARVIALDRQAPALRELAGAARAEGLPVSCVRADLETGHAIPLAPGRFGAVLVFRYLHRPLARALASLLAPGGLLLYETFTLCQRELGYGPENPDFLLKPNELRELFPELRTEAYREGRSEGERPLELASLRARKPPSR